MVVFNRVVRLAVGVVGFDVGGIVDALGVRGCVTFSSCSLCLYDHLHHPSLRCLELLLLFSVIVHVPDTKRSDGVSVASKSLALSPSGYFDDVNSSLGLVNVAHAQLKRSSSSTCRTFLKVTSCQLNTNLGPTANPPTTRAVTCRAKCTVGQRVFRCACLVFSPMRLACVQCPSQDRRVRAPTLPIHLPGPEDATFTALVLHPTCGWPRKWEIAGGGGTLGSSTSWMTNVLQMRQGSEEEDDNEDAAVPSGASSAQADLRGDNV